VLRPVQRFLDTEVASGVVLLVAALVALLWANSRWADSYAALWETRLTLQIGGFQLSEDLRHWVNDLLMVVFFYVVGLEIKRELVHGDLRDATAALLPAVGAIGGMVVPALLYLVLNPGGPGARGWGIPMATDIAFALGVLALLGRRAPSGLRVLLLTLAIVDDIGAILVIAIFYSGGVSGLWLLVAGGTVLALVALLRLEVRAVAPYGLLAALLWLAVFESGVHATIAGVVLGLLTPAWPFNPPERVTDAMDDHLESVRALPPDSRADEHEQSTLMEVGRLAHEAVSPLARLEATLHPWSAYAVLPLFALANAGVPLSADALRGVLGDPVTIGVIVGLVLGKPIGILGAAAASSARARRRCPTRFAGSTCSA
jgi:NhaA family Na+:H+ antiporter